MNKIVNYLIGLVAVGALVVSVMAYSSNSVVQVGSVGPQGPKGEQGPMGPRGPQGPAGKDAVQSFGSVTGPESTFDFECHAGSCKYYSTLRVLNQATTTVCALKSPSATSTLVRDMSGIRFSVSSTTAALVTLAKASTPFATTTSLGKAIVPANGQGTLNATSTPVDGLDEDLVFAPNSYFVVGMQGNGASTYSPSGVCNAVFQAY